VIPKPYIAKWREYSPWNSLDQVEQDLLISRVLVAIFSDHFLKENLAFRGGTALHKLYLKPAPRYSEDIDLVQTKKGNIGPILKQLGHVIDFFEENRTVKQSVINNTILYRFDSEYTPGTQLRIKVEINCREQFSVLGLKEFPFTMESGWFSGHSGITTFDINELLGTKLRALYQRKKGRDLFDLYYSGLHSELDYEKIIWVYQKYMSFAVKKLPSQRQFSQNIKAKQNDAGFQGDLEGLIRPGIVYDQENAFAWLNDKIIEKL